jgi:mevalonate kinase
MPQTSKIDHHSRALSSLQTYLTKNVQHPVKARACGKAIIVGEHAVVYGAEAIAMPLMNLQLDLELINKRSIITPSKRPQKVSEQLRQVIAQAYELLELDIPNYEIHCQSQIQIGAGLGSSAALCIALLRAICKSEHIDLPLTQLLSIATTLEAHFHGKSSGLDIAVVGLEKIIAFKREKTPEILELHPSSYEKLRFALIDSGVRASTSAMIQTAAPFFNGAQGSSHIDMFNQLSFEVRSALELYNFTQLASGLNESAKLLDAAGVVTKQLREIMHELNKLNVPACKPTGAGGGGFILALLDPNYPNMLNQIRKIFMGNVVIEVGLVQ